MLICQIHTSVSRQSCLIYSKNLCMLYPKLKMHLHVKSVIEQCIRVTGRAEVLL